MKVFPHTYYEGHGIQCILMIINVHKDLAKSSRFAFSLFAPRVFRVKLSERWACCPFMCFGPKSVV